MVKRPIVTPCHATLITAVGAECGWRYQLFFSAEDRRDFVVECEIVGGDLEGSRTEGASIIHWIAV